MCNEIRITSVSQFVSELAKLDDLTKTDKTRFFRGHEDKTYLLTPSIYRSDARIQNEDKIIKEAFTYCANDFLPHETLFEKLAKLQHYDYATRLLDISANALVGLYFAVRKIDKDGDETVDDQIDGEVIVLDIPNESIKYDDSDTVAILSAVSLRNVNFSILNCVRNLSDYQMLEMLLFTRKIMQNQEDLKMLRETGNNKKIIDNCLINIGLEDIDGFLSEKLNNELNVVTKRLFNEHQDIVRLLNDIRKDKPHFLPIIDRNDFNQVLCVKAKPNNPRISRQQGAFLLFGIDGNKQTKAEVKQEWFNQPNGKRFIIDKSSKQQILTDLATLGISSQTLFPELDKQAKPIMNKYCMPSNQ